MNPLRAACLWLAPEDEMGAHSLPLTLLIRPFPVVTLLILIANDHFLKGAGILPGWVTGKLSDFAGLAYFPFLVVTLLNLLGRGVELLSGRFVSLAVPSRRQLQVTCVVVAVFFALVQLSPMVAHFYSWASAAFMFWSSATSVRVTMDPTDLVALPVLIWSYRIGVAAIAKVPPGILARRGDVDGGVARLLRDVQLAQPTVARADDVLKLGALLSEGASDDDVNAALRRLRL